MYRLRCRWVLQAKKFGFLTHFKGFSIHFSFNPNFGTESFRRFSSFRSSVQFLTRRSNGDGERNLTMPSRNGKTLIIIKISKTFCIINYYVLCHNIIIQFKICMLKQINLNLITSIYFLFLIRANIKLASLNVN